MWLHLSLAGEKLGVWLALFPTVYLSAGTATALILVGGQTMKLFFQIVCGPLCSSNPLTTVEWYLVFTSLCIVLSQLPNLNSIAGLSLVGAVTAITYSTMVWVLSVSQTRPAQISYEPISLPSVGASVFSVFNALGIIAFAFRGHNLVLEIQVCNSESYASITDESMQYECSSRCYLVPAFDWSSSVLDTHNWIILATRHFVLEWKENMHIFSYGWVQHMDTLSTCRKT